jgi:signal transduction histidine kinase
MFDKNYMDSFPLLEGGYAFSVNKVAEYDAQFNDPGLILSMLFNEAELVAYLQSMVSYAELRVGIQYGDAYRWYGDSPSGAWYEFTKVDAFRYPFINTDMHFELHKTVGISQMNIKFIMLLTLFLVIALTVFELMHRRVLANYQFLLSQNTKLKENIKNRSDLFGFIAHELNTPLTLISSPTQQMLTHTNYDQQTYQHLKTILRNTEKMQQVIDRILELKRYQTRSLQPETLNIVEHLVQLYTPYKSMFLAKELLFIESGNIYDIIPLTVDKSSFNIVLDNLLSNALKYTPVHGTVEVNWHRDMQYCYISLSNSFPPLTAQQRNDIFTKYVRNTSSDTQGYGLGLGLVSEICERNQWFIQCNSNVSEEGKSELEFVLVLPVASTEPA